jgi:8-oxo-dGTP diphosphatase
LTFLDPKLRGVLTFPPVKPGEDWLVFVYTATRFEGELAECPEGDLEWVSGERLATLPLWEGDRIFLPWLEQDRFFSGKFVYREGRLVSHEVSFS